MLPLVMGPDTLMLWDTRELLHCNIVTNFC